jgi:hypothetical protein
MTAARGLPGSVGPRGDLHALLAQDLADRLDREALGSHLIDEGHRSAVAGVEFSREENRGGGLEDLVGLP